MCLYPGIRFPLDGRPAPAENSPSHAGSMLQMRIGGVDDCIGRLVGYISPDKLEGLAGGEDGFGQEGIHENILPLITG
jgi:hypothetical protein